MFAVRTVQRIWLGYFFSGWLGFDSVGFTGCSRRIPVFWPPAFRFDQPSVCACRNFRRYVAHENNALRRASNSRRVQVHSARVQVTIDGVALLVSKRANIENDLRLA